MWMATLLAVALLAAGAAGQRSPYAGSRPAGYKDKHTPESGGSTRPVVAMSSIPLELGTRFGEASPSPQFVGGVGGGAGGLGAVVQPVHTIPVVFVPTQATFLQAQPQPLGPIPVDALGDHFRIQQILEMPHEKRPFWYINQKHIEQHRNQSGRGF